MVHTKSNNVCSVHSNHPERTHMESVLNNTVDRVAFPKQGPSSVRPRASHRSREQLPRMCMCHRFHLTHPDPPEFACTVELGEVLCNGRALRTGFSSSAFLLTLLPWGSQARLCSHLRHPVSVGNLGTHPRGPLPPASLMANCPAPLEEPDRTLEDASFCGGCQFLASRVHAAEGGSPQHGALRVLWFGAIMDGTGTGCSEAVHCPLDLGLPHNVPPCP